MKTYILIALCFFLLHSVISAQVVPLAMIEMQEKEVWQNFSPEKEEFALEIPGAASPGIISKSAAANKVGSRSYLVFVGGAYYYMFSDALATPVQNTAAMMFAESFAPGIRPGVIYNFADNFGYYHKLLVVKTESRIYTFQSVSATPNNPAAARFFAGIKIGGLATGAMDMFVGPVSRPIVQDKRTPTLVINNGPDGKPITPAVRQDSGASGEDSPPSTGALTPLNILSKPRPEFTNYARVYQITGVVHVRVTFLANGTIGDVVPVKKLPFGLTEQAVEAARLIKFEPIKRGNVPFTVTKTVEYSFMVY